VTIDVDHRLRKSLRRVLTDGLENPMRGLALEFHRERRAIRGGTISPVFVGTETTSPWPAVIVDSDTDVIRVVERGRDAGSDRNAARISS